jgi:hypothetical protein
MKKTHLFGLIGLGVLAAVAAVLSPGGRPPDPDPRLPWKIELDGAGGSSVFGIALGKTTLAQARKILRDDGEVRMFRSGGERLAVEAYFQRIALSGLRADIVLALEVAPERLTAMFDRGLRLSTLPSGVQKVELAGEDVAQLADAPIAHLIYIPGPDLDEPLLLARFGEPAQRVPEGDGVVHWLYPDRGLDIAVNRDGREVFQYVAPARFELMVQPLLQGSGG